jgi:hypothetical protein
MNSHERKVIYYSGSISNMVRVEFLLNNEQIMFSQVHVARRAGFNTVISVVHRSTKKYGVRMCNLQTM